MTLTLLGWRRQVAALYAAVRAARDPETGWRTWRDGRDELFAGHPDSPLDEAARAAFRGLPYAPYDPGLRFEAAALPAEPQRLEVPTTTDGVVPFDRIGAVELDGIGRLDLWWLGSYGGGRYLLDTVKGADLGGADGRLVVDLNFAYHPSCTYDPRWSCPLAPEGNRITTPVEAGEQLPPGGYY